MRLRRALAAGLLVTLAGLSGTIGMAGASAAPSSHPSKTPSTKAPADTTHSSSPSSTVPPSTDCPSPGRPRSPLTVTPWYAEQLDYPALSQINQGLYTQSGSFDGRPFSAGDPVKVVTIDSGLNPYRSYDKPNPVFAGADLGPLKKIEQWQYPDCVGHGTQVASLIIAQPNGSRLIGIAPRVRLYPIQYTNVDSGGKPKDLVAALSYAINVIRPRVINMSLQLVNAPGRAVMDLLKKAERRRIVIVAAGGNDNGQGDGPVYPARYSKHMKNIIAVAAVGQDGLAAGFSISGNYMDVAAPGDKVPVAQSYGGALPGAVGTSFAAPLVTGTVALLLATHPTMSPLAVRNRLEATADPPPGTRPNAHYGYGVINPVQAITSERNDLVKAPKARRGAPLAAPHPPAAPDRTLEHRALAVAVVLLGLAALTVTGAAVLRGRRRAPLHHG
ncbi:S8 family serine peptidase [Jatrophihabitans endophyticus]|uniref:S8 family serine peptidase n=1 Tax=Jatrophihabitans endophyticus TaxID=1206085 RepID=UPI001A06F99E|nr:S8 family serine peptidase [Jatrophihabitans endophyticus]MBE7186688.1 S8 family serine peptidase [Jatrophihabitans endophyticus]